MRVEIYQFKKGYTEPVHRGYIEADEFSPKRFFDICNWSCRDIPKPECLHSDIEYCGHGIVFVSPITNMWYLALSIEWLIGEKEEIFEFVKKNVDKSFWMLSEEEMKIMNENIRLKTLSKNLAL